jgi:hypothetical protein
LISKLLVIQQLKQFLVTAPVAGTAMAPEKYLVTPAACMTVHSYTQQLRHANYFSRPVEYGWLVLQPL